MAIGFSVLDSLSRDGSYLDPTNDWTVTMRLAVGATPSGSTKRRVYTWGSPTAGGAYFSLVSHIDESQILLEVFDGLITFGEFGVVGLDAGYNWGYSNFTIRYTASGHTLDFFRGRGRVAHTTDVNFGTMIMNTREEHCALGTFFDFALENIGIWQAALTDNQIASQCWMATPVTSIGLLSFTSLSTSSDLADTSGNGHNWTAGSGLSTVTGTSLPPTAIIIPSLDYNTVQNFTGVIPIDGAANIFFQYKATSSDNVIGALAKRSPFTTPADGPWLEAYTGPLTAPVSYLGSVTTKNGRLQMPVTPGQIYTIRAVWDLGTDTFDVDFSVYRFIDQAYGEGDYIVGSDQTGYPAAVVSHTTGEILRFIQGIPGGEFTDRLANGKSLFSNSDDLGFTLLGKNNNVIASITSIRGNVGQGNGVDKFYVIARDGLHASIQVIDGTGTLGASWALPDVSLGWDPVLVAVNADETKAYITNGGLYASGGGNIAAWDLVNNVALADFAGQVTNRNLFSTNISDGALHVFPNGDVIAGYWDDLESHAFLRLRDSAGTTIRDYTFDSQGFGGVGVLDKIVLDPNDPTSFIVWYKVSVGGVSGFGSISRVRISDGALSETITGPEVRSTGAMINNNTNEGPLFGWSFSCPLSLVPPVTMPLVPTLVNSQPCCDLSPATPGDKTAPTSAGPVPVVTTPEWTPACETGGDVPTAPDLVAAEIWDY